MTRRTDVPVYRENLYSVVNSRNPYPHYRRLRELGPVVWLPKHHVYAITRYAGCKRVLLDAKTFISGDGVGLNPIVNRLGRDTTLNSDGEDHARRRKLVAPRMTPRALQTMKQQIEDMADSVVDDAVVRRDIDGVADLAQALPLGIVPDLVGWPPDQREHLLRWAAATFDSLGPLNSTALRTMRSSIGMTRFAKKVARTGNVLPGSLGEEALRAARDGTISDREGVALMIDYLAPSLDTTISGIASALHLLATHPDQWEALRADPSLIPNAANEALRFEAPIRAFTRRVVSDAEVDGTTIPRGSRVLVLYASANRDELIWENPDVFDIHRDASAQLAFGRGSHSCAGQGLARLETETLLSSLVAKVARIEPNGEPEWARNNLIRCHRTLPLRLHAI
ncbi:cytochrome P450 [Nocardioides sp. CPCC 206347]|uniref:cytochrome P450 n=1 Tax=unclassified Nocardioides TaxID=2615069 RepID=UPI00361CFF6A